MAKTQFLWWLETTRTLKMTPVKICKGEIKLFTDLKFTYLQKI